MRVSRCCLLVVIAFALCLIAPAEQIAYREGPWAVYLSETANCAVRPQLTVRGPGDLFDAAYKPILDRMTTGLTLVLRRRCPALAQIVLVHGRTKRLVRLGQINPYTAPNGTGPFAQPNSRPSMSGRPSSFGNNEVPLPGRSAPPLNTNVATSPPQSSPTAQYRSPQPGGLPQVQGPSRIPTSMPDESTDPAGFTRALEPYCQAFTVWSQTLNSEYPNNALGTEPLASQRLTLYGAFGAILRDESFVPVFGKRYDQLTPGEMKSIQTEIIRPCFARHAGLWDYKITLSQMFEDSNFRGEVISGRALREQLPGAESRIKGYAVEDEGYISLINFKSYLTQNLRYLLPTERKPIDVLYASSLRTAADRRLELRLRPVIESGDAAQVSRAASDYQATLHDASPEVRARFQQQIAAKVGSFIAAGSGNTTSGTVPADHGPIEFSFSSDLGPQGELAAYRSTTFSGAFQSEFRDNAEEAFPEIFAKYKAAHRHVFVYGGDVNLAEFSADVESVGEQRILVCGYANDEVNRTYFFWHSTVVGAARPPRLKAIEPIHPFLLIGRPMERCPADAHATMKIIRDNFRKGADYPVTHLLPPEPVILPDKLAELRSDWQGSAGGVRSCERFAAGRPDGLPYPRRPDLSAVSDSQSQLLVQKGHGFSTGYWGSLAYRDQKAYLAQLREYNRALLEMMK